MARKRQKLGEILQASNLLSKDDACRISLHLTPVCYCSDNAAMIAALGCHLFERGHRDDWTLSAKARIDLP